jgi:tetratricopeptide (TPR) repeat protein
MASTASALYIRPEIEKVPVARLVENLEAHLQKNPKDAQARFNLARLHAMAYSLKVDAADALKKEPLRGAWFGYEPRPVPFDRVVKTDDASKQDAARKHLEKAINLYDEVIKEKPDDLIAKLGRAWCIAQRANKDESIKEYRKVVEAAWAKEKDLLGQGEGPEERRAGLPRRHRRDVSLPHSAPGRRKGQGGDRDSEKAVGTTGPPAPADHAHRGAAA